MIESYGPYGPKLQKNYCMQLEDGDRIKEVSITHAQIIKAIEFVIAKPGEDATTVIFGDNGEDKSKVNRSLFLPEAISLVLFHGLNNKHVIRLL